MRKTLPQSFYDRPTVVVAKNLLGKYLVRRYRGKTLVLMITEVEAYDGPHDRASHAHRGRTARNWPMFSPAGHFYVYFTYGMHWLTNIVTGPHNYPAAVLLRGGIYTNSGTGGAHSAKEKFISGPARLTKFLHIGRAQNGKPASQRAGLWFEDRGVKVPHSAIIAHKRIGVDYAGPVWANKKYNFTFSPSPRSFRASRPNTRTR